MMISINSVQMPTPTTFQIGITDLTKTERNANGGLIIEVIATKRKLDLSYNYLSATSFSTLLNAISASTFSVTYPDAQTAVDRTATFYCSEKNAGAIDYQNGIMRYKDVKLTFTEV